MRAQNLSVCVPNRGCDKNCPYCVSKMTGYLEADADLLRRHLPKVIALARTAQISSVLLTGKGEPCLAMDEVGFLLDAFREFPCEMQTNGRLLRERLEADPGSGELELLAGHGLNVLAFSLDRLEQFARFEAVFQHARRLGLVIRVTFNLTDRLDAQTPFSRFISACRDHGVQQFSLRQVSVPNEVELDTAEARDAATWIRRHVDPALYERLVAELHAAGPRLIRRLPYGARVYDVDGVAVSYFDYCIQDEHGTDDLRSLILGEDGHLYTAWNSPASILF